MKTFIRTIVVLVVLNLATGCFALSENVSEREKMGSAKEDMKKADQKMKESEQKMRAAKQYDEMAERLEEAAERQAETIERQAEAAAGHIGEIVVPQVRARGTGKSFSFAGMHSSNGRIFVIPASEMKAEDLAAIAEDMRIMSRIFDKKLDVSAGGMSWGSGYGFGFLGSSARSTEAIFLQGYGVLFLMRVDFPLSPPAVEEKEAEEESKEHIDELWKETRQEIYEPVNAEKIRAGEKEEEYDEGKVEEMKETLIRALKHTANIRNLKANESVILTVSGSGESSSAAIALNYGANKILIESNGTITPKVSKGLSLEGAGFSPAVMTIRAKKSDVDAFAQDRLDFDEFRQKVQIFTY